MKNLFEITFEGASFRCRSVAKGSGGAGEILADFSESDLQGSLPSAQMVLDRLSDVRSGRQENWKRVGNSYSLKILPERVILENLYPTDNSKNDATIELAHFEDAVRQWATAIESFKNKDK